MEPWDGPASIAFTDGTVVGAVLDRNGLRPSRYVVTKDGLVVMASEVGVLDIAPENVLPQGPPAAGPHVPGRHRAGPHHRRRGAQGGHRRAPARTASGSTRTWSGWRTCRSRVRWRRCEPDDDLLTRQQAFGYTLEDLRLLMAPMAINGQEAVGSMGNDTPLAVLSDRPQLLFNYFKQLFAQVTNPPIDPIREELVMSTVTTIGPEGNLFEETPEQCHQLELKTAHPDQRAAGADEGDRERQAAHRDAADAVQGAATAARGWSRRSTSCARRRPGRSTRARRC